MMLSGYCAALQPESLLVTDWMATTLMNRELKAKGWRGYGDPRSQALAWAAWFSEHSIEWDSLRLLQKRFRELARFSYDVGASGCGHVPMIRVVEFNALFNRRDTSDQMANDAWLFNLVREGQEAIQTTLIEFFKFRRMTEVHGIDGYELRLTFPAHFSLENHDSCNRLVSTLKMRDAVEFQLVNLLVDLGTRFHTCAGCSGLIFCGCRRDKRYCSNRCQAKHYKHKKNIKRQHVDRLATAPC